MGSFGTIQLSDLWAMLEHCAPGYTRKLMTHNWKVMYNGLTYPSLPLGPHGRRKNVAIEIGHVKQMARTLGILPCAAEFLRLK